MRKINWILIISIMLSIGFLSGCQEQATTTDDNISNKIQLESEVVRLVHAKLIPKTDNSKLISMGVEYLFKNIAGRTVNIEVTAEFYDQENKLLYTSEPRQIENLPKDYVEQNIAPTNIISYSGEEINTVDHVKIIAEEY